jgi:hypothetical protein
MKDWQSFFQHFTKNIISEKGFFAGCSQPRKSIKTMQKITIGVKITVNSIKAGFV